MGYYDIQCTVTGLDTGAVIIKVQDDGRRQDDSKRAGCFSLRHALNEALPVAKSLTVDLWHARFVDDLDDLTCAVVAAAIRLKDRGVRLRVLHSPRKFHVMCLGVIMDLD